jgi:hypothetical protein
VLGDGSVPFVTLLESESDGYSIGEVKFGAVVGQPSAIAEETEVYDAE